jgi:hypothetical protein
MQYTKYSRELKIAARASAAPSIATTGGAGGLFLDVREITRRNASLVDLANHVQLVAARYGLQVFPVFSVNAIPQRSFFRLDHVEHGNLVRVTCQ